MPSQDRDFGVAKYKFLEPVFPTHYITEDHAYVLSLNFQGLWMIFDKKEQSFIQVNITFEEAIKHLRELGYK